MPAAAAGWQRQTTTCRRRLASGEKAAAVMIFRRDADVSKVNDSCAMDTPGWVSYSVNLKRRTTRR